MTKITEKIHKITVFDLVDGEWKEVLTHITNEDMFGLLTDIIRRDIDREALVHLNEKGIYLDWQQKTKGEIKI